MVADVGQGTVDERGDGIHDDLPKAMAASALLAGGAARWGSLVFEGGRPRRSAPTTSLQADLNDVQVDSTRPRSQRSTRRAAALGVGPAARQR